MSPMTPGSAATPLSLLDTQVLWGGMAFGTVFLAVWLAGVALLISSLVRRARGIRTTGEIVSWDHTAEHPRPIVRWDANDRTYERSFTTLDLGWYPMKKVSVWYDPDDPERMTTQLFAWAPNGLGWAIFTLPFGVVGLFVIGVCLRGLLP